MPRQHLGREVAVAGPVGDGSRALECSVTELEPGAEHLEQARRRTVVVADRRGEQLDTVAARHQSDEAQKLTDQMIAQIDQLLAAKEKEIMQV